MLHSASAQIGKFSKDTIIMIGKIKLDGGQDYNYKIKFSINPKTYDIVGLSLTDYSGPDETKAKIIGKYNPKGNEISFHETEVVKSKTDINAKRFDGFCFVHATLKFKKVKLLTTYSGKFAGKRVNEKGDCAKGEIQLIDVEKATAMLTKLVKKNIELDSMKTLAKEEKDIKKNLIIVAQGDAPILKITGNTVKLSVWDKGQIDGDAISLYVNNKAILKNYTLDATRKVIELPVAASGNTVIKLVAHNEGKVPPNTAMLKIESATEMYPLEVRANVNEEKIIYLKKK